MKDALKDFSFAIPISKENEDYLKFLGYVRRNGSCTYTHKYYVVVPLKLWYYPVDSFYGVKLDTVDEVMVKTSLKVDYPQ